MSLPFPVDASDPARAAGLLEAFAAAWRQHDVGDGRDGGVLVHHARHGMLALLFNLVAWQPWLEDALLLLDGAELDRVQSKHRVRDREELALGYALHRLVLGCVLQRAPMQVALGRDSMGRPCLPGDELHTSLSHADAAVAVAVSRLGCVGIDLEPTMRTAQMPAIAERVVHPVEAGAMASLPADQQPASLLALWVRKEALLKAAGIGLAREMDTFQAPADHAVAMPAADGPDGGDVVIRMLDIGPDWTGAIAGLPMVALKTAWLLPPG
jgi:4'-phosphopantetheinyl transferase